MECRDLFLVFFPVIKLCLDFLNSAIASIREPRGKFLGAVFAEIAVFQLAVSEQADLVSADIAIFFIKQSHALILRFS